ncbi:phage head morphogenesis protein [Virgibacillus sediminis]|uniref:Minor capsid protein n=1 Tax=Virgibacillus sediminis TaxID=202260 RepID=A0ABV7A6U5_9BACI
MARKVRPTRFPNSVAVTYSRDLKRQVREMGKVSLDVFDNQIKEEIKALKRSDSIEIRMDGPLSLIQSAITVITNEANRIYDVHVSTQIATNFVKLLDKANFKNMASQGKIKGVDPTDNSDKLSDFMEAAIQENVSYITNIKDTYMTNVERIILQGAKKSSTIKDIRQQLMEQTGMTRRRAEFIATDQAGTIFGQMTAERHQNMGVKEFIWRTSGDERVRESHEELDGKKFSYKNPPDVGMPGEDFRCRCVAEPVFE